MPLNFPLSPTTNDVYTASGTTWIFNGTGWIRSLTTTLSGGVGGGDAVTSGSLDQFANVTQTSGQTLAITASTTLSGGTHSGTNTGDQDLSGLVPRTTEIAVAGTTPAFLGIPEEASSTAYRAWLNFIDGSNTEQLANSASTWTLTKIAGGVEVYRATKASTSKTPWDLTGWTIVTGSGQPTITIDATGPSFPVGQAGIVALTTNADGTIDNAGTVTTINGRIVAGANVTLSGTGTAADPYSIASSGGVGGGTVTSVSVSTANGVSGSVATATTTPAITLTLGAITPSSVAASGTVTGSNLSGTNTGDNAVNSNYSGLAADIALKAPIANPTFTGEPIADQWSLNNFGSGAFRTQIIHNGTLSANRILYLDVGNAARILTFAGDATISGTNTGDNAVNTLYSGLVTNATHTGDVTGSGALTIANDAVTLAKLAAGTAGNLITYDASGNPAAVATGTAAQVLTSNGAGAAPTFQAASGGVADGDKGDITVSASGATWTIDAAAVTLAKMANLAQDQFIGRTTASTGVPETATITAAARTVLDDATVGDMVNTLGGATSTGTGGIVRATSPTITTPTISGAVAFPDGVRQTFNPDATNAGLNVGSHTADPSSLTNGDLFYNSTDNTLSARINGATVDLGAGGSGSPGGSTTQIQLNNAGSFGGVAGLIADLTTGAVTQTQALTTSATAGLSLVNSTAATNGNQRISPSVVLQGNGFATSPATSHAMAWRASVLPVQGTATVTGNLVFAYSHNGGAWTDSMRLESNIFGSSILYVGTAAFSADNITHSGGAFYMRSTTGFVAGSAQRVGFSSTAFNTNAGPDTNMSRASAGVLQIGTGNTNNALGSVLLTNLTASGYVKTGSYTVATLPGTPTVGMRAQVTDANATTYLSTVAAGGANVVPVFYDGTNWKIA